MFMPHAGLANEGVSLDLIRLHRGDADLQKTAADMLMAGPQHCSPATGTGLNYPELPVWSRPAILNYTQAVEIDGQFFFSGTPWDMVARNYSALTLNLANNSTLTQADVVGGASASMQLLMWQQDIVGVATPWNVLMPLVPCLMLLMTHQSHLHQPWRLDRCSFTHCFPQMGCGSGRCGESDKLDRDTPETCDVPPAAVNAEEGVGVSFALDLHNSLVGARHAPHQPHACMRAQGLRQLVVQLQALEGCCTICCPHILPSDTAAVAQV